MGFVTPNTVVESTDKLAIAVNGYDDTTAPAYVNAATYTLDFPNQNGCSFGASIAITHDKIFVGAPSWSDDGTVYTPGIIEQLDLDGNHEVSIVLNGATSLKYNFGGKIVAGEDCIYSSGNLYQGEGYSETCFKVDLPVGVTPNSELHSNYQGFSVDISGQPFYGNRVRGQDGRIQTGSTSNSSYIRDKVSGNRLILGKNWDAGINPASHGSIHIFTGGGADVRRADPFEYRRYDVTDPNYFTHAQFAYKTAMDGEHIFSSWRICQASYGEGLDPDYEDSEGVVFVYDLNGNFKRYLYSPTLGESTGFIFFGEFMAAGDGRLAVYEVDYDDSRKRRIRVFDSQTLEFIATLDGWSAEDSNIANTVIGGLEIGDGRILVGLPSYPVGGSIVGRVYVYDLDGNLISTIDNPDTNTQTSSTSFGQGAMAIGSGRIVIRALDSVSTGPDYIYIYETPHQTSIWDTSTKLVGRLIS